MAVSKSLDRYFQEKVMEAFGGVCQRCLILPAILWSKETENIYMAEVGWSYNNKVPAVAVHHIIHRTNPKLRHDARNGIPLCLECHAFAHKEPIKFNEWVSGWLQRNYGITYEDLKRLSNS